MLGYLLTAGSYSSMHYYLLKQYITVRYKIGHNFEFLNLAL